MTALATGFDADQPQSVRRPGGSLLIATLALLGAAVTAWQLTRPGLLFGLTPDVSVYLGGAVRLVHGAVPYRDFVFVQPPGFVLLATPLGWLSEAVGTRDALAVLRLCTPLLAAAAVAMVGRLLRHRGPAAVLAGCAVMALYPAELYAIRGPQLEPVIVCLCLAGALLVFDADSLAGPRRLLLGGVVLGFAVAVKQTAVVPMLVIGAICVAQGVRRRALPFLGGAAAGLAVPILPFLLLAPGPFLRDTVATQLGRIPASGRVPWTTRLADLTGVSALDAGAGAAIAVAVAVVAVVVAAARATRGRPSPLESCALLSTVLVTAAQFAPARYYAHYAAFTAPFLAALLGVCASRLTAGRRHGPAPALAAAPLVALLAVVLPGVAGESVPDVATVVEAVVPDGGCAISDSPVYLFTSDRFQAGRSGCTVMTDPAGTTLALDDTPQAVTTWRAAFAAADYVVTAAPIGSWDLPAAAHLPEYVAAHFHAVHAGLLLVYVRDAPRR